MRGPTRKVAVHVGIAGAHQRGVGFYRGLAEYHRVRFVFHRSALAFHFLAGKARRVPEPIG